ncbi:hypothetical protein [Oceanobacillus alkalisoli]|uniref:hypothetical protein n=1 Tax=Oceanobacillus alkalisoli TaxID=2925113 RepID=UPI001EEFBDC6|nr:hypothetical protein [Oceanobacillus alkalisoli]MCF3942276.1 hypothetical protein [Oceanobacillus alkalisoli]MCG5104512.1 hypothetical protein [Oceanobacillus alkalisoli]
MEIGAVTIYWYDIIIATAAALGFWLTVKEAERLGLEKDLLVDLTLKGTVEVDINSGKVKVTYDESFYDFHVILNYRICNKLN